MRGTIAGTVLGMAAAMWAEPLAAQCVVDVVEANGTIAVDRGDGVPIDVVLHRAPARATIPVTDGSLAVDVQGGLAMAGTGPASLLSLADGTYGGVLEVYDGGFVRIVRARSIEGGLVEIDVALWGDNRPSDGDGDGGTLVGLAVPCGALVSARDGSARSGLDHMPLYFARPRRRLALADAPDASETTLRLIGLYPRQNVAVIEERDGWRRISIPLSGATLRAWVTARSLRRRRGLESLGVVGRGPSVGCGTAREGLEHAIVARGTPLTVPGTDRVWTTAESDDSMLVRVRGEEADILTTTNARGRQTVGRCVALAVLGVVPTASLTRDVVSVVGLRMRPEGGGYLLERHPGSALMRDDLHVGDVFVTDPGARAHDVARALASPIAEEQTIVVLRDGVTVELPPRAPPDLLLRGSHVYRGMSELERALAD